MLKHRRFIGVVISFIFCITIFAAIPSAVIADGPYTATLRYYDDVQITYSLNYPTGGLWSGAGDIPIGGAGVGENAGPDNLLSSQIYCIDPFIPFHSRAESSWDSKYSATLDVMGGYAVAAPWAVSGALQKNYDAINWLVANGYRGDYLRDDQESQDSVGRLNGLYVDFNSKITKRIALMATKVAIWKVVAGDSVKIIKTSLSNEEFSIFDALVNKLVGDAKTSNGAANATKLSIMIDDFSIHTPRHDVADEGSFFGPLKITVEILNTLNNSYNIQDHLRSVFLTKSGPESDTVSFVYGGPDFDDLDKDIIYGTMIEAQYIGADMFDYSADGKTAEINIYIKTEYDRDPGFADQLGINVMAKAENVELSGSTLLTYVYAGSDGIYDWNEVQAYVGSAKSGIKADLYGEALIYTGTSVLSSIYVMKDIADAILFDNYTDFTFKLYYNPSVNKFDDPDTSEVLLHHCSVSNSLNIFEPNAFTLKNGGGALIEGMLTKGYYWIVEDDATISLNNLIRDFNGQKSKATKNVFSEYDYPDVIVQIDNEIHEKSFGPIGFEVKKGQTTNISFTNNKKPQPEIDNSPARFYFTKYAMHDFFGNIVINNTDDFEKLPVVFGEEFEFQLEKSMTGADGSWQIVDITEMYVADADTPIEIIDNKFYLQSFDMIYIELDPAYKYRVTEFKTDEIYDIVASLCASYEYDSGNDKWELVTTDQDVNPFDPSVNDIYVSQTITVKPHGRYYFMFGNASSLRADLEISKNVVVENGDINETNEQDEIVSPDAHETPESPVTPEEYDRLFNFQVLYMGKNSIINSNPWPVPLKGEENGEDSFILGIETDEDDFDISDRLSKVKPDDEANTVFSLKHGETATIKSLPAGPYKAVELNESGDGFDTEYSIFIIGDEDADANNDIAGGSTGEFTLLKDTHVKFTNKFVEKSGGDEPKKPGETEEPTDPVEPENPDEPDEPEFHSLEIVKKVVIEEGADDGDIAGEGADDENTGEDSGGDEPDEVFEFMIAEASHENGKLVFKKIPLIIDGGGVYSVNDADDTDFDESDYKFALADGERAVINMLPAGDYVVMEIIDGKNAAAYSFSYEIDGDGENGASQHAIEGVDSLTDVFTLDKDAGIIITNTKKASGGSGGKKTDDIDDKNPPLDVNPPKKSGSYSSGGADVILPLVPAREQPEEPDDEEAEGETPADEAEETAASRRSGSDAADEVSPDDEGRYGDFGDMGNPGDAAEIALREENERKAAEAAAAREQFEIIEIDTPINVKAPKTADSNNPAADAATLIFGLACIAFASAYLIRSRKRSLGA